jgi:thiamine-monophosphate kinase
VPLGEFDIIARYFSRRSTRSDVLLGVGDDAALLLPPAGEALVVATDTLVEGRHFLAGTPASAVGHQALAVNLSDLAAMGAEPAWALLSLSLPHADEHWIAGFAEGLHALADRHDVALVGGDTVSGPLVITVEVLGFVPPTQAVRRAGAHAGDLVVVSGSLGVAAAGLAELQSGRATFESRDARVRRFLRAEPRLALGRALRGIANAAMDVSDGLLGDLGKLAAASGLGACIDLERLPIAAELAGYPLAEQERLVLHGGDDYELLFTLPADHFGHIAHLAEAGGCNLRCIGSMVRGAGVECRRDGTRVEIAGSGYDHFDA